MRTAQSIRPRLAPLACAVLAFTALASSTALDAQPTALDAQPSADPNRQSAAEPSDDAAVQPEATAREEGGAELSDASSTSRVAPTALTDDGISVPTATWIFFGVGAGSAALVGLFGGLTLDAQSTFAEEPTWEHADTFYALRATTNVAIGVAGAALLTGAIIWVVDAAISKRKARTREASERWAVDLSW